MQRDKGRACQNLKIQLMKKTAIVLFGSFIALVGCKKENTNSQSSDSLEGKWELRQHFWVGQSGTVNFAPKSGSVVYFNSGNYTYSEKGNAYNQGKYEVKHGTTGDTIMYHGNNPMFPYSIYEIERDTLVLHHVKATFDNYPDEKYVRIK
jgi:hypothetical protein